MDYLVWYRNVLAIPVQNGSRCARIDPIDPSSASAGFRVTVQRAGGATEVLCARKVVLATGIQGGGEW
jgi:cation diffusion facilitator CzcD-associated flavoprotein CzcO